MPRPGDDRVDRVIDEIERALQADDPALLRRFRAADRAEVAHAVGVVGLLAVAAVLLTVGFATLSWFTWCAGAAAFVASAAVDQRYRNAARQPR